ncbi:unnamed protein product [Caenorhabditis auriculariae]|uniref:Uncharacterized protein n=1 Tax=Caenorhabditis auriculariae TaxID=2777116 RepID=A0A8S1HG15_9PELO|nr:unnamed protein product [Caenorhabditis auriculariae]
MLLHRAHALNFRLVRGPARHPPGHPTISAKRWKINSARKNNILGVFNAKELTTEKNQNPCVGTCSHTMCTQCKDDSFSTSTCTYCERKEAFIKRTINYIVKDILFEKASKRQAIDGHCSECLSYSSKLRICLDCGGKSGFLKRSDSSDNKFASFSETSAYKVLNHAICCDCLIDGAHENHQHDNLFNLNTIVPPKRSREVSHQNVDQNIPTSSNQIHDEVHVVEQSDEPLPKKTRLFVPIPTTAELPENEYYFVDPTYKYQSPNFRLVF